MTEIISIFNIYFDNIYQIYNIWVIIYYIFGCFIKNNKTFPRLFAANF